MSLESLDGLTVPHLDPGRAPARVCFEIVLFYDTPRSAAGQGFGAAIAAALSFLDARHQIDALRWYRGNTMKASSAVKGGARAAVDAFLDGPEFNKPGIAGLTLHAGPEANAPDAPAIVLLSLDTAADAADPVHRTMLRLCLPPSIASDARELFDLAAACMAKEPVHCGHAGWSWFSSTGDTRMERSFGQHRHLLLAHPAMGYHDPLSYHPFIGQGLIQVGWLTMLGLPLLAQAEETAPLTFSPDDRVGVSRLPEGGALLVAGTEPILGSVDPATADQLRPFHAVGRQLADLRLPDEDAEFLDFAGDPDEADKLAWYRRFFGD